MPEENTCANQSHVKQFPWRNSTFMTQFHKIYITRSNRLKHTGHCTFPPDLMFENSENFPTWRIFMGFRLSL
jgi:hypothetical protein